MTLHNLSHKQVQAESILCLSLQVKNPGVQITIVVVVFQFFSIWNAIASKSLQRHFDGNSFGVPKTIQTTTTMFFLQNKVVYITNNKIEVITIISLFNCHQSSWNFPLNFPLKLKLHRIVSYSVHSSQIQIDYGLYFVSQPLNCLNFYLF